MRFTTVFISFIAAAALSLTACGGGGDDGGSDPDADTSGNIDASNSPDANTNTGNPLGTSCTPDAADPQGQGTCPTGYTCLNLQGGTGAWCSKTCIDETDTSCDTGFDQPGLGYCLWQVDFDGAGGNDPVNYCGIICNDLPGDPAICPDCADACPANYLQCTAELGGPPAVAEACQ